MSKHPQMPQFIKDAYQIYCAPAAPGVSSQPIIAGGAIRDALNGAEIKDIDIFVNAKDAVALFDCEIEDWTKLGRGESKLFGARPLNWDPSLGLATPTLGVTSPLSASSIGQSVYTSGMSGNITVSIPNILNLGTKAEADSSYTNNRKIVEVYEKYDRKLNTLINLIIVEVDPKEYVTQYFDFGICKAWYDGSYVHMHGDYTTDVNNKTITMTLSNEHVIACYGTVEKGIAGMREHADRINWKYPGYRIVMPSV